MQANSINTLEDIKSIAIPILKTYSVQKAAVFGSFARALIDAKAAMQAKLNRKVTFSDVINEFIRKKVNFLKLDLDIQNYILAFVDQVKQDKNVLGLMLFGSVARGLLIVIAI